MIYRKSDVKKTNKKSTPKNWELILSHEMKTGITSGVFKGTSRSDIARCIECLSSCVGEIDHPLFLPLLVFSYNLDSKEDKRHRDNRERVRVLENVITEAAHIFKDPDFTKRDNINLAQINSDLVDCHKEVLWKRPEGYLTILESMQASLVTFKDSWPHDPSPRLRETHLAMERRVTLLRARLQGISTHRQVTISRLKLVERILTNLVSLSIFRQEKQMKIAKLQRQRTTKLEESREEEHRQVHKAQRDLETELETRKQTAISFLSVILLPGAFLAVSLSPPLRTPFNT
jgi:hypothetical protein